LAAKTGAAAAATGTDGFGPGSPSTLTRLWATARGSAPVPTGPPPP
jgi:hypothetical protein